MKAPKSAPPKNTTEDHARDPRPPEPLVNSPASAKREEAALKRERERLESEPTPGDDDAHATLI